MQQKECVLAVSYPSRKLTAARAAAAAARASSLLVYGARMGLVIGQKPLRHGLQPLSIKTYSCSPAMAFFQSSI